MDTIKLYLDNMFRTLPNNEQLNRLKSDMLANMEDKYHELKSEGKSENEAIGIVIAEFGNIDELLVEMDQSKQLIDSDPSNVRSISLDEAYNFIATKKYTSKFIAIGVSFILFGTSLLILLYELIGLKIILTQSNDNVKDVFPLLPLFLCVIIAVALLIYASSKDEQYTYIKEGEFKLSKPHYTILQSEYDSIYAKKALSIIPSVALFILAPVIIIIGTMINDTAIQMSVCIVLIQIAFGVSLLIISQAKYEAYEMLLKRECYTPTAQKQSKFIGAVASIVWPLAVALFLYTGLVHNQWNINWVIFPVTGIIFGGFCAFYSSIKEKSNTN